ncbi:hypothetical protein ElyMa_002964400, partial [Elysia marginata]
MLTAKVTFIFLLALQGTCEGFDFTYQPVKVVGVSDHSAGDVCGVLHCEESLVETPTNTRKLTHFTIYRRVSENGPESEQWKQLATLTPRTPKGNGQNDHLSGELSDTRGHLRLELVSTEDCQSIQFSCTMSMVDDRGEVTVVKSVVGANIGADLGPGFGMSRQNQLSTSHETGQELRQGEMSSAVLEKLRCIESRLSDLFTRDDRLGVKVENLKDSIADKLSSLERNIGDKLQFTEMRVNDKVDKVRDRVEDKLSALEIGGKCENTNQDISCDACENIGAVESSIQSMEGNFSSFSFQFNRLDNTVTESKSAAKDIDSKLN